MEKRLILRGFGAGALGGLFAFIFSRIMLEPVIQQSIDYESGREAAEHALQQAAGTMLGHGDQELFSRGIQSNVGLGIGLILFGAAMGGVLAVAYVLVQRRTRTSLRPRVLALLVAGAGFLGLYLVPFLKYPANPPAVGHESTIGDRTLLYLVMVVLSVTLLIAAVIAARRLAPRLGGWNAALVAGIGFAAAVAVAIAVLPPLGHLPANVAEFGRHATETPLPLRNASGTIVYPGFPADVLFEFRLLSLVNQAILWGTIGLGFGWLVERMLAPARRPEAAAPGRSAAAAR